VSGCCRCRGFPRNFAFSLLSCAPPSVSLIATNLLLVQYPPRTQRLASLSDYQNKRTSSVLAGPHLSFRPISSVVPFRPRPSRRTDEFRRRCVSVFSPSVHDLFGLSPSSLLFSPCPRFGFFLPWLCFLSMIHFYCHTPPTTLRVRIQLRSFPCRWSFWSFVTL